MKSIIKYLLGTLALTAVMVACKKDENRITLEGGTAPVLTSSSAATRTLVMTDSTKPGAKFIWSNPNYTFTTGVSSQDVTYVLEVDTAGTNFKGSRKQEISIARSLEVNYSVKELNAILSKMDLLENIPHNMEFRIKATLANGSVPLYSNVVKITITPYLDVVVPIPTTGALYITGNAMASDWTNNPPATQKFTKVSNTEYYIIVPLVSGKEYKFLSTLTQWQPQYGTTNATGTELAGDIGYNLGAGSDPASIKTPADAGNYKITVNFKTGRYTVVKQ